MAINGRIGEMGLFIAAPAQTPLAAVIVVPEIFGLNPGIQNKCILLAQDGYLAVAPDIFWRFAPGVELDPDVPDELQQAFGHFGQYDPQDGVDDIEQSIRAIRAGLAGHAGIAKVGLVGYCLGGRLAFMAATRTDIDCSVGYYGVGIDGLLGESHAIARPLMLHIAGADHLVGPEAQAAIHAGLDAHPRVTLHDYPGLDHGFATQQGARLADARTAAFFAEHLA